MTTWWEKMTMKIMNFERFEIRKKSGSEHMRHLLDSRIRKKRIPPYFQEFWNFHVLLESLLESLLVLTIAVKVWYPRSSYASFWIWIPPLIRNAMNRNSRTQFNHSRITAWTCLINLINHLHLDYLFRKISYFSVFFKMSFLRIVRWEEVNWKTLKL